MVNNHEFIMRIFKSRCAKLTDEIDPFGHIEHRPIEPRTKWDATTTTTNAGVGHCGS